eukprot:559755_1
MVIYFAIAPRKESLLPSGMLPRYEHNTVETIRANAEKRKSSSVKSKSSAGSRKFAFSIFDGTPAEDSPWLSCFEDDFQREESLIGTVIEEEEESTIGSTALLGAVKSSNPGLLE